MNAVDADGLWIHIVGVDVFVGKRRRALGREEVLYPRMPLDESSSEK